MGHRRVVLVSAVLAATGLTACSAGRSADAPVPHPYTVPTSTVTVPRDGVSWMQGSVLHVAGRSVETGVAADSYALLPDGVLLRQGSRLWFSDTESRARVVGDGVVSLGAAQVSPDGRYVGFLDSTRGPADENGDRFYRLDVIDTRTGRQTLASVRGMGDLDETQPEQYEDADPSLVGLDDEAAYVIGVDGSWAYPLDGSAPHRTGDVRLAPRSGSARQVAFRDGRWRRVSGLGGTSARVSPDGATGIADADHDLRVFDARSGRPLTLSVPGVARANKIGFGGWLGGGRFWGFAFHGSYAAVIGTGRMVVCSPRSGSCSPRSGVLRSTDARPVLVGGAPAE